MSRGICRLDENRSRMVAASAWDDLFIVLRILAMVKVSNNIKDHLRSVDSSRKTAIRIV